MKNLKSEVAESSITELYQEMLKNAHGPVAIRMTNDYLFKMLMQEADQVLRALICALLHYTPDQLKDLQIINPIIPGDTIDEKSIVLDVRVIFNNGSILDLEMQVVNELNWPDRSLYYACRNFTRLNKGKRYEECTPSIHIGLLDFTLFPEHRVFYSTYRLKDDTGYLYTDKLSIRVVDLTMTSIATADDRHYNIDKWAQFFKSETWEEIIMLAKQDTNIAAAATTIYQLSEDERFRQQCEAREDFELRQRSWENRVLRLTNEIEAKDEEISAKDEALTAKNEEIASKNEEIASLRAKLAQYESSEDTQ